MQTIEQELKKALKTGSKELLMNVYETIYNNFYKLVFFQIGKYIKDEEVIKDLTNETFISFFNNANKVNKSVKYYLMMIARNSSLNYLQANSKSISIDFDDEDVFFHDEDHVESNIAYKEFVNDLLKVLSKDEVKLIIFHAVDGYSFKEIAEKLNKKASNLSKTYERAIKKYRSSREER